MYGVQIRSSAFLLVTNYIGVFGCPDTWITFQGFCYTFVANKTNWFHAEKACRDAESVLADIQSAEESNFLKQQITKQHALEDPQNIGYWSGGNDLEVEGRWVWGYPDGEPMTYTDWFPGEPNNIWYDKRPEDCVSLWGHDNHQYSWNDEPCDNTEYYICKTEDTAGDLIG